MKNFLGSLTVFFIAAGMIYSVFGPVLIGIFFLVIALREFVTPKPGNINIFLGFVCGAISLFFYIAVIYWGWGEGTGMGFMNR